MIATTPNTEVQIPWYTRIELPTLLPGVLLSIVMVLSVIQSIAGANWATGLDVLLSIVLPALIVGIVFARISWLPMWLAHPLSAALGIAWSIQQIGPLLAQQVAREFGPVLAGRLGTWGEQASEILLRTFVWLRILQAGGRGEDIVLFIVTLTLLTWVLGYGTGWLLFRSDRTWLAVVLNAVMILINYTFTLPKPTGLFFLFLAAALLLLVHQNVIRQQRIWQVAQIDFPAFLSWRFMTAAGMVGLMVVLITSVLPGTVTSTEAARAWQVLRSPFTSIREGWQDAFSTINAPPGTSNSFVTRSVGVGGARALGDAIVMLVRTNKFEYWRAVAFDRYTGRSWQSVVGERARADLGVATPELARTFFQPGALVPQVDLRGRTIVTQTIELVQARSDNLLMVGGQFMSSSLPVRIQHGYVTGSDQTVLPNFTETAAVFTDVTLQQSQIYTVTGYVSTIDEQSLRQAGTNYPEWVTSSYLQLPDTVPQRVRDRAQEIVRQSRVDNPYDQALRIQESLRGFTYDESRPAPPEGRDWVDYFLFDTQRGYCDDFATSMVVMLRSLNIPARWVQGYAGGTVDPQLRAYVVRESVAHSWVEVYFPGYGWQRFEPTPAPYASVPVRPATPPDDPSSLDNDPGGASNALSDPDEIMRRLREMNEQQQAEGNPEELRRLLAEREAQQRQQTLLLIGAVVAVLLTLIGVGLFVVQREMHGLSPAEGAYARLGRLARWGGIPQQPHVTPREYAEELGRVAPEQRESISRIVEAYVTERYSPVQPAPNEDPSLLWQALRWPLISRLAARFVEQARERPQANRRRIGRK